MASINGTVKREMPLYKVREEILNLTEKLETDDNLSKHERFIMKVRVNDLTDEWRRRTFKLFYMDDEDYI